MQGNIIIRGELGGDRSSIEGLIDEVFADAAVRKLVRDLRSSAMYKPELSCVAELGGEVMGSVLYFPVSIRGAEKTHKAVHMSPIAVREVEGRQGVGERLVRHGIQRAHGLGYEIVLVMGPRRYFAPFHFQPAIPLGIRANLPLPPEDFMVHTIRPELAHNIAGSVAYPPGTVAPAL